MSSTYKQNVFHTKPVRHTLRTALGLLLAIAPFAAAQTPLTSSPAADVIAANVRFDLPDSPGTRFTSASSSADNSPDTNSPDANSPDPNSADPNGQASTVSRPKGSIHMKMVIHPGEVAGPMSVRAKVVNGMTNSVSLFSAAGWFAAAGWEQLWNSSPNYGTDSGAFGQRLGAATLRGVSEGVFSNSLFAPLFHEDPRYYIMGPGKPFLKRAFYAGTRAIITRTDSGRTTPNFSLIAGNLAGSALTIPYYPPLNTSFKEVMITFGGSIGGSALGFVVDEFIVDALIDLHIKKRQP